MFCLYKTTCSEIDVKKQDPKCVSFLLPYADFFASQEILISRSKVSTDTRKQNSNLLTNKEINSMYLVKKRHRSKNRVTFKYCNTQRFI